MSLCPELLEARKNIREIEMEIDTLIKIHNSFTKKEIVDHGDMIVQDFDDTVDDIKNRLNEFAFHMKSHKKYIYSKSRFMSRHYSREKAGRL